MANIPLASVTAISSFSDDTGNFILIVEDGTVKKIGLSDFVNILADKIGTTPPANIAPTVNISINKSTITTAETATLTASANDPDGTISKVEFLLNDAYLGEDITFPYTRDLQELAVGQYSYKARAYDNSGNTTMSNTVLLTVTAASSPDDTSSISNLQAQGLTPSSIELTFINA